MPGCCQLSGKQVVYGNKVSHSNRKTRRSFAANLQKVSLLSDLLGRIFSLRVAVSTLRSVEVNGGLDAYLLSTPNARLPQDALRIKKMLLKKEETTA